jgi:hypothetical protein
MRQYGRKVVSRADKTEGRGGGGSWGGGKDGELGDREGRRYGATSAERKVDKDEGKADERCVDQQGERIEEEGMERSRKGEKVQIGNK